MATQKFKEEFQQTCWIDEILISQQDQSFAKCLRKEKKTYYNYKVKMRKWSMYIPKERNVFY